jgi:phosphatidate phosphatase APP1
MSNDFPGIRSILNSFRRLLGRSTSWIDDEDDLFILPYRGYANDHSFFVKGRVLEDEELLSGKSESQIRNIIDSLKRFETDELPDAAIKMDLEGRTLETKTDHEGYFIFNEQWDKSRTEAEQWIKVKFELPNHKNTGGQAIHGEGEIYLPSKRADFGILTDIDDTVLQTHVTSRFKLKMIYATFAKNAKQRLPMEGIVDLFRVLTKGGDGQRVNPIFYVSSSPWNIYDLLAEFMDIRGLPKGPILLRDYGIDPSGAFSNHKMETISRVLKTYPDLPFVMLGDTAHNDADFYIDLAKHFPGQIKVIYIRQTKDTKNARRIARLIEETNHVDAVLIQRSAEIMEHAREIGLLV